MGAVRKPKIDDAGVREAYLGVTGSARGLQWRERLAPKPPKSRPPSASATSAGTAGARARLARYRGVDDVPVALDPTIKALMPDPSVVRDMDVGARRIADAIEKREKIAVFGDYDVDGACSSALMKLFLAHHGIDARIFIPDRLWKATAQPRSHRHARARSRLIITVDCGTTSFETLAAAKPHKTDVVVVDHHQAESGSRMSWLSSTRTGKTISPGSAIFARQASFSCCWLPWRANCADATSTEGPGSAQPARHARPRCACHVCDVVPLKGLNRAYVTRGLQVMHARSNTGLKALADASGLAVAPTAYHLGFVLGPRINAGGRIGDAALGARLLSGHDDVEVARIAVLLDKLNRERKAIETATLEEAVATAIAWSMSSRIAPFSSSAERPGIKAWWGGFEPPHRALPASRHASSHGTNTARVRRRCGRSTALILAKLCGPPSRKASWRRAAVMPWLRALPSAATSCRRSTASWNARLAKKTDAARTAAALDIRRRAHASQPSTMT